LKNTTSKFEVLNNFFVKVKHFESQFLLPPFINRYPVRDKLVKQNMFAKDLIIIFYLGNNLLHFVLLVIICISNLNKPLLYLQTNHKNTKKYK